MAGGTCKDCKHWYTDDRSVPYGTCVAPIARWVFDWLEDRRLSLGEARIWAGHYSADECESFEEGEA